MAASRSQTKTVTFYRLLIKTPRGLEVLPSIDWREKLHAWADRPFSEQRVDETFFIPEFTRKFPTVGIHRPSVSSFQSVVDKETATVSDILDGDETGGIRSNSTAVAFLPKHGIIAAARGNNASPSPAKMIETMLTELMPPDPQSYWHIKAIADSGKLATFRKESDGISKVEIRLSTMKDLLSDAEEQKGLWYVADRMAHEIGSELEIDLTISLKDSGKQHRGIRQRFKKFIDSEGISRIGGSSKAKVLAVDEDGTETGIINLVEHAFAVEEYITTDALASKIFSLLMDAVANAAAKREDEVYRLVG